VAGLVLATLTGCSESPGPPSAAAATSTSTPAPASTPIAAANPTGAASGTGADAQPVPATEARSPDPFAGIDASQHDVLRNIARIDPAARGVRPAAGDRPADPRAAAVAGAVTAPVATAPSTAPPAVASVQAPLPLAAAPIPLPTTATPTTAPASVQPAPIVAPVTSTATVVPTNDAAPVVVPSTLSVASSQPPAGGQRRALAQPRPAFPVAAIRDGHTEGRVIAALTVGADGTVSQVSIVSSTPTRSFGRAAATALRDWRYEAAPGTSAIQVELVFRAD
jgi:TonB family protein